MLRPDLRILARPETGGCVLIDEKNHEEYEFGEVEYWLIEGVRAGKTAEALCPECNARFSLRYRVEDIDEFLGLLSEWGLMSEACGSDSRPPLLPAEKEEVLAQPSSVAPEGEAPPPSTVRVGHARPLDEGETKGRPVEPPLVAESAAKAASRPPGHWHLFDPRAVFDGLGDAFHPLRFLVWLTPLAFAVGAACVAARPDAFIADLARAYARFGVFGRVLFAALSVNLASQLVRGVVARRFGIDTPSFGLTLAFGLIPRFNVPLLLDSLPDRYTRLWVNVTSTLVRLWLFAVGSVSWAMFRQSGSNLAVAGVELALIAVIGLFFVANPLWNGDGSRFLSAVLDFPDLHRRSRSALRAFFVDTPATVARHRRHSTVLGLFGLASVAVVCAFAAFIAHRLFTYLELNHRGAGVALFVLLGSYVSLKLWRVGAPGARTAPPGGPGAIRRRPDRRRRHGVRLVVLLALAVCALLPYRYETGGDAEVLPLARATISPEMDGVIEEVFVSSGQSVKAGEVLARMADYQYLNEIWIIEADIAAKQNEILRFQTTPSRAEMDLAEERVNTARIQVSHTEGRLQRQKALMERGFISQQGYDDIRRDLDRDRQLLVEASSSLEALRAQINPYQIALLRDELQKLMRRADHYREQVRRTRLIAPFDGRIVTSDVQYQRNSYREAGQVFTEMEDTGTVFVRVAVPEFDLVDVAPGAAVRVRFWAFPQREFAGVVEEIEPAAIDESYGRIVYVKSRFSNEHALLKSGLTGFAKIEGQETVLALAFTRALVRFVVIEMWSWLP